MNLIANDMETIKAAYHNLVGSYKVHKQIPCATASDSSADKTTKRTRSFVRIPLFQVRPVSAKVSNLQLESIDLQLPEQLPRSSCCFKVKNLMKYLKDKIRPTVADC